MRTMSKLLKSLAVLSALLSLCSSGMAGIVYDNSLTDLQRSYGTNNVEFGDEINLAGTDRLVNNFKFEYFLSGNASGNETVQVKFYINDGPLVSRTLPDSTTITAASPGTLLGTSPVLSLATGFNTAEWSQFEVLVPDTFTWTVMFEGVETGEVVGLRAYDPPTVGSSFDDFWQKSNGTWNTYILPDSKANFAARVSAVPEPTTLAYVLLAGLSGLGYLGYRRRAS
jgi:hypothetical protein